MGVGGKVPADVRVTQLLSTTLRIDQASLPLPALVVGWRFGLRGRRAPWLELVARERAAEQDGRSQTL